jgi:hypothetical protein
MEEAQSLLDCKLSIVMHTSPTRVDNQRLLNGLAANAATACSHGR